MVFNGLSSTKMPRSLPSITDEYSLRIAPANYAFAIWGLIYTLLFVFVVYQALPNDWVPSRNNTLIFTEIGYQFFINMMVNSVWLVLFQTGKRWGFFLGLIDIILILISNVFMMQKSIGSDVTLVEWIAMRAGFSIYSGWVTAATILNVCFVLKSFGMKDPNVLGGRLTEEQITIPILWVAMIIYNIYSYREMNPLYGTVFIWVITAIRNNLLKIKLIMTNRHRINFIITCRTRTTT